MAAQLHYRLMQISRLGGTVPQMIGSFVVGIPVSAVEEYGKDHPEFGGNEAAHNLISHSEHQKMLELLRILRQLRRWRRCRTFRAIWNLLDHQRSKEQKRRNSGLFDK